MEDCELMPLYLKCCLNAWMTRKLKSIKINLNFEWNMQLTLLTGEISG